MSIIFDALKKAKGAQVDKLFRPISNKNGARAPKLYSMPENLPAEQLPRVDDEEGQSAVSHNLNQGAAKIAIAPPPPPQYSTDNGVQHPYVAIRTDRGKLVSLDLNSRAREQFALLRSKLIIVSHKLDARAICVTSSLPNEGKTFVATNLALALAAESRRGVVIVDSDLRKPSLHQVLGVRATVGLAEFLQSERTNIDSLIIDTDRRLAFIPAGHPPQNPLQLIDSEKMRWLIGELRNRYDFVIIDGPPIAPLADAEILASMTDGLLLVIRAGLTPLAIIQKSLKMLSKHKVLGSVLNGAKEVPRYGYYYQNAEKT